MDLDESHMSVRSARKRLRRPQRREGSFIIHLKSIFLVDTGTEVVVAIPRNLPDPPAINASNSTNTNANNNNNNNNATRRVPPKQKRPEKLARLIAAEIRYLQRTTHPLIRYVNFILMVFSLPLFVLRAIVFILVEQFLISYHYSVA